MFVAGMVIFVTITMIALLTSSFVAPASANCAFGGQCLADSHTATGDANNPKSFKNTGTVDTSDKCFPNKQKCG